MQATFHELKVRHWRPSERYWAHRFRPSIERLRATQLRSGSPYSNLRTLIPVLVLGLFWLWIIRDDDHRSLQGFLSESITVRHLLLAFGTASLWSLWLSLSPYQNASSRKDLFAEVSRLTTASVASSLVLLIGAVARGLYAQACYLAGWTALSLLVVSFSLLGCFTIAAVLSHRVLRKRHALIVGTGRRAEILKSRLLSQYSPFALYGCVDDEYYGTEDARSTYLGAIDTLPELLKTLPIEIVLIGLPIKSKYDEIQRVIDICESVGVESHYMSDLFSTSRAHVQFSEQHPHHFAVLSTVVRDPKQAIKRIFDLVGASIFLVLFSPVMVATMLAIRFTSPGPIFFVQQRYGRHRKLFPMFKFRSMVADAEVRQAALEVINEAQGPVFKLRSDPRVTRVGTFIRKTSIDELPQLFNVLRGEMSLVGPRPLPLRDVSRFQESWLLRRFSIRPGLTCLWQISGRSNTTFDDWIKQDLRYIDEWSLWLDCKILVLTIPAVVRGSGAV